MIANSGYSAALPVLSTPNRVVPASSSGSTSLLAGVDAILIDNKLCWNPASLGIWAYVSLQGLVGRRQNSANAQPSNVNVAAFHIKELCAAGRPRVEISESKVTVQVQSDPRDCLWLHVLEMCSSRGGVFWCSNAYHIGKAKCAWNIRKTERTLSFLDAAKSSHPWDTLS